MEAQSTVVTKEPPQMEMKKQATQKRVVFPAGTAAAGVRGAQARVAGGGERAAGGRALGAWAARLRCSSALVCGSVGGLDLIRIHRE